MDVGPAHFGGNFLSAFTAAKQAKKKQDQDKQELDAKMKLFEVQLQREQQANAAAATQQSAQQQIMERLSGSFPLQSIPGQQLLSPQPQMGLTDLLADPQNAALMLKSGYVKGEDLINLDQQNRSRTMLQGILGGAQSPTMPAGPGPIPTQLGAGPAGPMPTASPLGSVPPSLPTRPREPPFQVSGIKLDARGNPMIDLSRPTIKTWVPSPRGDLMLGLDDRGNVMATRPPGPSEQPAEDRPMPTADILKYRDARGQPPQPGMTPRQISAAGYTPITTAQEGSEDVRSTANAVMNKLDDYVGRIFTAQPGFGRYMQGAEHLYQRATQRNPDVALYESFSEGTLAPLLRSMGERGTLSDPAVARALSLIPKTAPIPDTRDVALGKLKQLREILNAGATPGGTNRGAGKGKAGKTLSFHELPP